MKSCALGDIFGRVGTQSTFTFTDPLSPPLYSIGNKGFLLECATDSSIKICAATDQVMLDCCFFFFAICISFFFRSKNCFQTNTSKSAHVVVLYHFFWGVCVLCVDKWFNGNRVTY